jgi:UPF0716 protein FxsA
MRKVKNLFLIFFLLFTIVPLLELYILFVIANIINWKTTFIIVVATGIIGAYMAKRESKVVIRRIRRELNEGRIPGDELINGLCVLMGGAFLLTPGMLTDAAGFTLIIPSTRVLYKNYIKDRFSEIVRKRSMNIFFR